jgi:hypothetical protein
MPSVHAPTRRLLARITFPIWQLLVEIGLQLFFISQLSRTLIEIRWDTAVFKTICVCGAGGSSSIWGAWHCAAAVNPNLGDITS